MRISDWSSDVCSSDLSRRASPLHYRNRRVRARNAATPRRSSVFPPPRPPQREPGQDRKSVVSGKSVSVRVDLGGGRIIKKKTKISVLRQQVTALATATKTNK